MDWQLAGYYQHLLLRTFLHVNLYALPLCLKLKDKNEVNTLLVTTNKIRVKLIFFEVLIKLIMSQNQHPFSFRKWL